MSEAPSKTSNPDPRVSWAPWFVTPLLVALIADLWSKHVIFARYRPGETFSWWGELTYNTGVAWGIGGDHPGLVLAMTLVLIPVLAGVWWVHYRSAGRLANAAFGLVLGGALGNAWDRLMSVLAGAASGYQGVRDFIRIDLNIVGIDYPWPNFNLADSSICVGFVLLLVLSFLPSPNGATAGVGTNP